MSRFTYFAIYRNDSLLMGEQFLSTDRWVYNKFDKYDAEYMLTVTDADF